MPQFMGMFMSCSLSTRVHSRNFISYCNILVGLEIWLSWCYNCNILCRHCPSSKSWKYST